MSAARLLVNADIGERGADHPVDRALMAHVDIANIACGGHAGDAESVRAFRALADARGARVTAHLSYPDRAGFGREAMTLPPVQLRAALDAQRALMPDVRAVKLHGALYNATCVDAALATEIAAWLASWGASTVLTLPGSALEAACRARGIAVLREAFADRRYAYDPATRRLTLVPRSAAGACIERAEDAAEQVRSIAEERCVAARVAGTPRVEQVALEADTICIHSDSPIALDLARAIA